MSEKVKLEVELDKPPEGMEWHETWRNVSEHPHRAVLEWRLRPIAPATVTLTVKRSTAAHICGGPSESSSQDWYDDMIRAARAALAAPAEVCGVMLWWSVNENRWFSYAQAIPVGANLTHAPCTLPKHGPDVAHRTETRR